jgi:hypothetical protein
MLLAQLSGLQVTSTRHHSCQQTGRGLEGQQEKCRHLLQQVIKIVPICKTRNWYTEEFYLNWIICRLFQRNKSWMIWLLWCFKYVLFSFPLYVNWDSSVSIEIRLQAKWPRSQGLIPNRCKRFLLFSITFRLPLTSTVPPIQWVPMGKQ